MFFKIAKSGKNDWWRYLLGIILVFLGVVLGQIIMALIVKLVGIQAGLNDDEIGELINSMELQSIGIGQNLTLVLLLLGFVGGLVGLWVVVKFLHQRHFQTLITPFERINWRKFFFGFGLWMGLSLFAELVFYFLSPEDYTLQFQPGPFFGLLLVSLFLLPLQTSFEELFFRGYLMQGLGLISVFRWIPLLLTSAAFGLLHFENPEVDAFGFGTTMAYYIGVGLFLGIVTLMDDGLELALGVHAATNIFSALFVTFDDSAIPTAAIFRNAEVNMPLMLGGLVIAAVLFTGYVAQKYGWKDWSKCYGKIDRPHLNEV